MKKQLNVKMEAELLDAFKEQCRESSIKIGGRVEELIKNYMEARKK